MTSLTDLGAILHAWSAVDPADRRAALATVVYVKGSAYRHPGARMLITAAGPSAGMISGGCLEDDVREHARAVIASGAPRLVTYDTTSPADIVFGLGLGCSGVVKVLVEPVNAHDGDELLTFLAVCHDRRQTGRIVTIFSAENSAPPAAIGTRLLRWPDGNVTANFADEKLRATLLAAMDANAGRRAAIRQIAGSGGRGRLGVLVETIAPPVPLLVFGGGDDALPLVQFAKQLGWHVTVIDARPAYAVAPRFPTADAVLCARPEALAQQPQIALAAPTVAMIMTHSFARDRELLRLLLPRKLSYLGILGPRARTQRLLDELAAEGTSFSADCLARLHGPAGLDIAAETPEEIAVSIIAEMRAVLGHRTGGSLRLRAGGIHEPIDDSAVSA